MGNLSQLLDAVSGDPPPPVFDLNAVIARGNRQRRVRIAGTAALSTAVVIAGSTGVFALADHNAVSVVQPSVGRTPTTVPASATVALRPGREMTEPAPKATARLRAASVASLQRSVPGSTFEWTLISGGKHDAPFTYYSSQGDYKAAGLVRDSRGESYVFIDVEPRLPDSMFDACNPPTGAKPSPCRQYVAPDGSVVSESTFKTSGGNIQYVVTVERPDGTSVGAMETNSLPGADPVTRSEPNVTAAQLAALGLELTAYPPGYPGGKPVTSTQPKPGKPPTGGTP
ncbi:hypothetical protein GCM10009765_05800 [Fodinicola feengrottensis]|uniref:Uncharacterized protein n=1 Tax=Fodinicola feengrottensis TaxID=435914 RepID=A0ABN2FUK9_9ACTN